MRKLIFGFTTYARYLNQNALDESYTDSFGRVIPLDLRNEVQLYKVSLNFKGWLLDPKFQYLLFAWTNNANQGEGAQVVLAGFLRYAFDKRFNVSAGIMPLPTTRSTNYSFPKWLRHDNRVMADEFYRGSYTSGIDVFGEIVPGLQYRAMIGNNLSTLGVSSKQLDNRFDTVAASVWWMPTTGEFGENNGFGDYDYHQKVATFIGLNYTHSTETAQGQPLDDSFENSQIRLTDGTLVFSPDPFLTGGKIEQARYQMASIDAGVKYRGFSLEGQWYWRRVDNFQTIGTIPVDRAHGQRLRAAGLGHADQGPAAGLCDGVEDLGRQRRSDRIFVRGQYLSVQAAGNARQFPGPEAGPFAGRRLPHADPRRQRRLGVPDRLGGDVLSPVKPGQKA